MATYEWESKTLGQNAKIQEIVVEAARASDFVTTNIGLAKSGLQLAQAFLLGVLNPKVLILNAIADEIDNFANDFKGTGFHVLEVVPTGFEIIPTDPNGDPIKILYTSDQINELYERAKSNDVEDLFLDWTKNVLGESNFEESGPTKNEYLIPQGRKKSNEDSDEGGNTDTVAEVDDFFGIPKLTFSQVVTQMVGAMDDKLDTRRPQFSDSAEVGGLAIIIGVSDLSTSIDDFKEALDLFVEFFGGDNGIVIGGFKNVGNLIAAPFKAFTEESDDDDDITLNLINVSSVRGTTDDKEKLDKAGLRYNTSGVFEEGELVIGPRVKFGKNAIGIVKTANTDLVTSDAPFAPYSSQTVVISPISKLDAAAFKNFSNGAQIQSVSYFIEEVKEFNQNTGDTKPVKRNSFKFMTELTDEEAKNANTKVSKQKNSIFLKPTTSPVLEEHKQGSQIFSTKNFKMGTVFSPQRQKAPPPNFKAVKLEDIISEFGDFFVFLNTFADTIRNMAGSSSEALEKLVKFLNEKIKELDELNKVLQRILKLFSVGLPQGGVYVLSIPNTIGGNEAIKNALQSSTGKPTDDLDFCVGYLIVGGGPSMKTMNELLGSL